MENCDFEKKYNKYIKKLKNELSYVIWEEHNDFKCNFEHDPVSDYSFLGISWFVLGAIGSGLTEHKAIPHIIFFVVWLGVGIFFWIYIQKDKKAISDYFFRKYKYHQIIEDRIKRDKQREIQNLLDEMFDKNRLNFVDLDEYKLKLNDIKDFYDRCLSQIKYEQFEEKIR